MVTAEWLHLVLYEYYTSQQNTIVPDIILWGLAKSFWEHINRKLFAVRHIYFSLTYIFLTPWMVDYSDSTSKTRWIRYGFTITEDHEMLTSVRHNKDFAFLTFPLNKKTAIIMNITKTFDFDYFNFFIVEQLWNKILIWHACRFVMQPFANFAYM